MAVFQHQGKWKVEVWQKGVRVFRKTGLDTELDAKIEEKKFLDGERETNTDFVKLCESRLEDLELKRSEKHFNENLTLIKGTLIPRWGKKKRIIREDIEAYLNEVARESKSKANKRLRLIRALFTHGVSRGWLKHNPTTGITRFPVEKKKRYIPPIEDLKLVLEVATPKECLYLKVMIHTLGRMRAVNYLKWEDVYSKEGYVSLFTRKAKCSDLKEIRVPMNEDLKTIFESLPHEGDYVFMNPKTKTAYDHRDKLLASLCKWAGVKEFTYHCLRHFGASVLDNLGAPITDIQQILGHERTTTTDAYLQAIRNSPKRSMKKMEGLV